ncbi:RcnB family protein [Novosphingobium sp. RD2P27]|uniref:RcnB family protein n=1 Tax=Novosphingobium kalidii TaxID=3230299 RepID=A0ABV2CZ69_9SPHN
MSALVLAAMAMTAPTLATAQERSERVGARSDGRLTPQDLQDRERRMERRAQRQSPSATATAGAQASRSSETRGNWRAGNVESSSSRDRNDRGRTWDQQRQWQGSRDWRDSQGVTEQRERSIDRNDNRWSDRNERQSDRSAERWRDRRGDWNGSRADRQIKSRTVIQGRDRQDYNWRSGSRDSRNWDRGWRNNSRYDWTRYRARNQNVYRAGRYYAPYSSYSYRRIAVGFTLGTFFYGQRYWISDPWQYRLPAVYGPYRWVRYYDDVVLVDVYNGRVVDVIYDFFW